MVVLAMCSLTAFKLFDWTYSSQILDDSTSLLTTMFSYIHTNNRAKFELF